MVNTNLSGAIAFSSDVGGKFLFETFTSADGNPIDIYVSVDYFITYYFLILSLFLLASLPITNHLFKPTNSIEEIKKF